jgi:hypothetical protein
MENTAPLPQASQGEERFRWRGGGVSRIEGLSDGVFALALTLLIVSLEVPKQFDQLHDAFRQVPVFLLTFAMIGWLWSLHHQFHRRFGLEDATTITWNLALLFLVLLYVYPLKFLAASLCQTFGIVDPVEPLGPGFVATGLKVEDMQTLMILYSSGYVAIFGALAMLYRHAWSLRDALGLDAGERILTRATYVEMLLGVAIGALSVAMAAASPRLVGLSGMIYMLNGPIFGLHGGRTRKRLNALAKPGTPRP